MNSLKIVIYAVALVILLFLSFFFSSSDMAYGSVDIHRYENELKKNPQKRSLQTGYKLSKNYDKTISTILLLNDTVNAGLDSISTLLGVSLAMEIIGVEDETWGLVASMICLVIKILFGEILAKSMGKIYNFKLTVAYSKILNFCTYLFYPITIVVAGFGKLISMPITKNIQDIVIKEDDLHEMVDDIEKQGSIDEQKADLLHDVVTYTHTEAYEVMTPRVDFYAIDIDDPIEDILDQPVLYKYTRVPVYKDTIDNILGFVKPRYLMIDRLSGQQVDIRKHLQEPLRFPRSMEINDILKEFKKSKKHVALIMDEYGGVEGMITMEDILEEIVGEIWDEKDDPEQPYVQKKDGSYIIDGSLNLEDFCSLFDLDFDKIDTEYVTVGGFCIELLDDHFAKRGDKITFEDLLIEVLAVDKNGAIEKLHVRKVEEEKEKESRLKEAIKERHENLKERLEKNS